MMEYVDTHCHLDFPEFQSDRDEVVARAAAGGVKWIVNVGSSLQGSEDSVRLSERYPGVYASVGVHPHDASSYTPEVHARLCELARSLKVVGIGEIGLDYYRLFSGKQEQQRAFEKQLDLVRESGMPAVIHTRQADDDTIAMLKNQLPSRFVIHCFSGSREFLRQCLDLNALVSFTANITYKKAEDIRGISALVPLDRMMLETDAPFLSPEGARGKRNEPVAVVRVAEEIATARRIPAAEVARATTATAKEFFRL